MRLSPFFSLGALLNREAAPEPEAAQLATRALPLGPVIEHCTVPGVVALTFDDGPFFHTPHILDLLDQYGFKATFFVNGDNWVDNIDDESTPWPEILRRIVTSGHQLGSHTWSHVDMTEVDSATRKDQMQRLDNTLIKVVGKSPTYFRPPYGSCQGGCLDDMKALGYYIIDFDLDTKDYLNNTPDTIATAKQAFAKALDAGSPADSWLALAHDVHEQTAIDLVPYMLEKIKQRGYKAVTVGECLGDAPANWYRSA